MERERSCSAGMASAIGGAGAAPSASAVVLRTSASSGFDAAEHRRVHASERSLNGPYTKSTCAHSRTPEGERRRIRFDRLQLGPAVRRGTWNTGCAQTLIFRSHSVQSGHGLFRSIVRGVTSARRLRAGCMPCGVPRAHCLWHVHRPHHARRQRAQRVEDEVGREQPGFKLRRHVVVDEAQRRKQPQRCTADNRMPRRRVLNAMHIDATPCRPIVRAAEDAPNAVRRGALVRCGARQC